MSTTARRTARRFARRAMTTTIAAAAVLTGTSALSAPAASAATGVYSCFTWSSGYAYANQPVHLLQWNGSSWVKIRSGKSGANGCSTFYNTPSNVHLMVQGYTVLNSGYYNTIWSGYSPRYTGTGAGTANVGTGVVRAITSY